MNYLPIFYNISGKKCLVVGAGAIAARKAELLLKAGGEPSYCSVNFPRPISTASPALSPLLITMSSIAKFPRWRKRVAFR